MREWIIPSQREPVARPDYPLCESLPIKYSPDQRLSMDLSLD